MSITALPLADGRPTGPTRVVSSDDAPTVIAHIHQALDDLTEGGSPRWAGRSDLGELIRQLERASRRLDAVKLAVIAAADDGRVGGRAGHASTGSWVSDHTRTDRVSAAREVRLAQALAAQAPTGPGAELRPASVPQRAGQGVETGVAPQPLAATRGALAAGDIPQANAAIIVDTLSALPAHVSDAERVRIEGWLVTAARHRPPARLRPLARRALGAVRRAPVEVDAHVAAVLTQEEDAALAAARITMHDHPNGTTSGHFVVPTPTAHTLRKILQTMTAPRRSERAAAPRPWTEQQGAAFVTLLEHLPTESLATKTAATVLVTIPLADLTDGLGTATLDTGTEITAHNARRLACSAGIIPAVLDGEGLPVDLGRTKRLFTEHQRAALATLYDTCAAETCDRPYRWCELHHRTPWSSGGTTDLRQAIPLCGHHHRLIHHPEYEHSITRGEAHPRHGPVNARLSVRFRQRSGSSAALSERVRP